MPRQEKRNQQRREEAQRRILDAAMEMFARYGYEKTTVQSIAREAQVAQGLLYHYFAGKQDLLRALFERSMADVRASFALAQEAVAPEQRIESLLRHSFAILRENSTFWKLSYSVRMQPAVMEGLADLLGPWMQEIQATLVRFFEEIDAPQPAIKAMLLFALIEGIAQQVVVAPDQYPLEAVITEAAALFAAHEPKNLL